MATPASNHACSVKPVISHRPRTVSVNGRTIPRGDIGRETQNHPAATPIEAWQAAARALVVRELLLQEARRLGIAACPETDSEGRRETEDEALVRGLVEQEVKVPAADEATCRRYYLQNRGRFRSPDLYEARHILLPAAPGDAAARKAATALADRIIAELGAGSSFAALAAMHSACPSARTGGNLGQIGSGQTVPEFDQALAKLPVGETAPHSVETRYGLHVVQVERRIAGRDLPFEAVRGRIAEYLEEAVRRSAIRQYIALLAGRADIVGVEFAAAATPLVQ